jgi:dipeptidyl aminopeptidase/acylaminoacyl peptidase
MPKLRDAVDALGYIDKKKVAIGGHSWLYDS